MSIWRFSNLETFQAALSALPSDALARPVRTGRDGDAVWVAMDDAPDAIAVKRALNAIGCTADEPLSLEGRGVSCWPEVLPMRRIGPPEHVPAVLFVLDGPEHEQRALDLAGELVRLGCDRQELANVGRATLLRASAPPYYTVLRALDGGAQLRAFLPCGQVWVEAGFQHAHAARLRGEPGRMHLLCGTGPWRTYPDGPWTPLDARLDVLLLAPTPESALAPTRRLSVPLRLGRAPIAAAGLWISADLDVVDALIQELPESVASQLDLAVLPAQAGRAEQVLLRARGSSQAELPGRAFTRLNSIPSVFIPVGTAIEPPMRPERLRAVLAPPEGTIGWIEMEGDRLRLHYVAADRFVPLDTWVDYLLDRDADLLTPWVQSVQFAFEGLRVVAEPTPRAEPRAEPSRAREPSEPRPASAPKAPTIAAVAAVPAAPEARPKRAAKTTLTPDAAARAVEEAERAFLDLEAPADDAQRTPMWVELAGLYERAGRTRESGLAWSRAAWTSDPNAVSGFDAAMRRTVGSPETQLNNPEPAREQVRAVAAAVIAGTLNDAAAPPWLDRHGHALDLRCWWMSQTALASNDPLTLARARDRVYSELRHGLPVARELPPFLRFSGLGRAARLGDPLERMREQFFTIRRTRHPLEAPVALTRAYVDLLFAWGFARLGMVDRAADLQRTAVRSLPSSAGLDPVHAFCSTGLSARIAQALDGAPGFHPLPPALGQQLNTLTTFDRYKVDRFRQACTILEPQEQLDPIRAYTDRAQGPEGEAFASLRAESDTDALAKAIGMILTRAQSAQAQDGARLLAGVLAFLPAVPAQFLGERLAAVLDVVAGLDPEPMATLCAEALSLAALTGDAALIERAAGLVHQSFSALGPNHPAVTRHLPHVLRSFRRARPEGAPALLDQLVHSIVPAADNLPVQLSLAAGLLAVGRTAEANPAFEAAWLRLDQKIPLLERMALTRALSRAQAFATPEAAVAVAQRLMPHLSSVTDNFTTSSHFAVSLIEYAECLVLSLAQDELSLGERGRRIAEEDEFLLRQRVHRELRP